MADYDAQLGRDVPTQPSAAQRDADDVDLLAGLRGVAELVADARSVPELLGDVAHFASVAIPHVDGASCVLKQPILGVRTVTATADFIETIDRVQYDEFREGPCLTCMESGRVAISGSLGSDDRWPHFGGRVARMDVHSALSLPLIVAGQVIGAINAYAKARDAFGEHAVAIGVQFAASAAVSVYHAQLLHSTQSRTEQLQRALGSRAVIDQAIGIIRSRTGASAEQAFERLAQLSQHENVKLATLAERLVDDAVRRARARHRS
ncbi:ANTAR domain-containing protein [Mycolicibacterium obuense]|uniref:ANTAR domain protein n=1 Tax=Mycolicibacterium obuense TaxID=1807 RepID=A0A0J6W2K6_9MYCO|nr:GAF and ANTAR domain-containing protein [Mycolicibacterium obuense]KMO75922.1 ANTAR domain protein [Mycolicibacterium obuense]